MKWFIITVVLAIILVLGFAFYRNWIVVEKDPVAGSDATKINITVDRAKARQDLEEARQQARELVGKAREGAESALDSTTVKGEIKALDPKQSELTLMADGQAHVVRVQPDSTIQRDQAKVGFEALKVGDHATISFKQENGVKTARSITVDARD